MRDIDEISLWAWRARAVGMNVDELRKLRRTCMPFDVEKTFTYHSPKGNQAQRYEDIRGLAKVLAQEIQNSCPESREKSLALTNLQQAIMWANASIAINEADHG